MDTLTKEEFSKRLARMMDACGLTPIQLAAELERRGADTAVPTVKAWLAGVSLPRGPRWRPLADALGVKLIELMG